MLFRISLESRERTRELYIFNFLVPITKIGLLVFLVPFLGIMGAVWAYLITETMSYVLIWALFNSSDKNVFKNTSGSSL